MYERNSNIKYIRVKTLSTFKWIRFFLRSYLSLLDIIITSLMMRFAIKKHFHKSDIYYVICLDTMYCVKAGIEFKSLNQKSRVIASARCPHAEMYSSRFKYLSNYFFSLEKKSLESVDQVWSNGYDTANILRSKGFSSQVMLNGVDYYTITNELPTNEYPELFNQKFSVINVSTLLPIKGIYELIEAVSILLYEYNKSINLILIGKGDSAPFEKHAEKLKVNHCVFFLGHKQRPGSFLKAAKLSTCLSGGSGLSMSAIESMASAIPVVAWNSDVYQQFNIGCTNMKLVKEGDVKELAYTLNEMIENYDFYLLMAKQAKDYAKQFDWIKVKAMFLEKLDLIH